MYGFNAPCGEYVEGIEIHPGQIHFACPKVCKGVTISEGDWDLPDDLCGDCTDYKKDYDKEAI